MRSPQGGKLGRQPRRRGPCPLDKGKYGQPLVGFQRVCSHARGDRIANPARGGRYVVIGCGGRQRVESGKIMRDSMIVQQAGRGPPQFSFDLRAQFGGLACSSVCKRRFQRVSFGPGSIRANR